MKKQTFILAIEAIKKQKDHDKKCNAAFQVLLPNDFVTNYDNHWIENALMMLLHENFKDDNQGFSLIEYFCWELDFGRAKGAEIKNAGELYDKLTQG